MLRVKRVREGTGVRGFVEASAGAAIRIAPNGAGLMASKQRGQGAGVHPPGDEDPGAVIGDPADHGRFQLGSELFGDGRFVGDWRLREGHPVPVPSFHHSPTCLGHNDLSAHELVHGRIQRGVARDVAIGEKFGEALRADAARQKPRAAQVAEPGAEQNALAHLSVEQRLGTEAVAQQG